MLNLVPFHIMNKLISYLCIDNFVNLFIFKVLHPYQIKQIQKKYLTNKKMTQNLQSHILSKFKIVKKIGSGAYGHVWKVIDSKEKKVKALKKNFDAFNNSTDAQRTYRQIMFLMQLKHPNIVKLQQVIRADNNNDIYLIFEHMDIDLFTLIREGILQQKHKKWILYQICKSMYYLHSAGLIHRDLKPSNILVNQNCDAKLCDFGLVRSLDEQQEKENILTQYIATRWYRAPQILVGSAYYTKAIDIWGMGCMIGQIFKGKPLFPGTSTINQMQRILAWTGFPRQSQIRSLKANGTQVLKSLTHIKRINRKQFIPTITQSALDLIQKCLQFDPQKRIKIQQLIKHPYLKEFYNKSDLITQNRKIRVSIDDNQRLTLKQYRNLIYKQIKSKDTQADRRQSVDKTLYRIRDASTKKHIVSVQTQNHRIQNNQNHQKNIVQKGIVQNKKLSTNLIHTTNNTSLLNRYSNSLSAPKATCSNNSSVIKKKSHSINSTHQKQKSVSSQQKQVTGAKGLGSKHIKTMESQWNPIETKKAINFREQMKKTKTILTNTILTKPKRSLYQMQTKKVKRTIPASQYQNYEKNSMGKLIGH